MRIIALLFCLGLSGCKSYIYRCPIVSPDLRVCVRSEEYIRSFEVCKLVTNYINALEVEPVLICGPR